MSANGGKCGVTSRSVRRQTNASRRNRATPIADVSSKLRNSSTKQPIDKATSSSSDCTMTDDEENGSQIISISLDDLKNYVSKAVKSAINELNTDLATRIDFMEGKLTDILKKVDNDVKTLDMNLDKLCKEIESVKQNKESNSAAVKGCDKPIETAMTEVMREKDERERKKKNVIIFNVPESKSKDIKQKIEHDEANINELVGILEINPSIHKVIRLGKADDKKCRPILLKLETEEQRHLFLSSAKKLGKLNPDNIIKKYSIKKDLTKIELDQEKSMIKELNERRKKGEEVTIRNGKIVQRIGTH